MAELFNQADLVPFLHNNIAASKYPPGSLRRSEGYKEKVTDNPNMSEDSRSQPIYLNGDGVPFYKDKFTCRSGWAFGLRTGTLDDEHSKERRTTHMIAFEASEYLTYKGKRIKK